MRTVVTWRRFADVQPSKGGEYLVICESGWLTTLPYYKDHEAFCWSDIYQEGIDVVYWAEIGSTKTLVDEVRQENWNNGR